MSVANPVVLSWNGAERRIYLKQGVTAFHWIDDIYIEYRRERRLTEDFRKYNAFVLATGNEPKGGGKATPRLLKLLEGVKVIAWDESIEIYITGEAITDNADVDPTLFDNSTRTQPLILNYQPPAAEVIVVDAIAESLDYGGVLMYDENNAEGVGQHHPVGTSANPVNNMVDGAVLAVKYHLWKVSSLSDINSVFDFEGFSITGLTPALIFYSHGFKAHLTKFSSIKLSGDFNNSLIKVIDANVLEALNVYGAIDNSYHSGRIKIAAGQNLNMSNCKSGIAGLESPELDLHEGADTTCSMRNFLGGQKVTHCDTVNTVATLGFGDGGKPHLEPSCTAGLLSVRGIGYLDNRSSGTTIDTDAWINAPDIDDISYIEKWVYINTEAVVNGNGKESSPFNNVSAAVDFAESKGWRKLMFLADATLERTLKNFTVVGVGLPTIDFAGQNVDKSEFMKVGLTGLQVGTITAREVLLLPGLLDMDGAYKEVGIAGDIKIADGGNVSVLQASAIFSSTHTPFNVDFGSGYSNGVFNLRKASVPINVLNMNTATKFASLSFVGGGMVTLLPSNTSGYVNISGLTPAAVTDNSAGTIVNSDTLIAGAREVSDIKKMTINDVVVDPNTSIATVYEDDNVTEWDKFDLSDRGRIKQ